MPNDEPATESDSTGSEGEGPAETTTSDETPAHAEHSMTLPESPSPGSSNAEASSESEENDQPDRKPESTTESEQGLNETENAPHPFFAGSFEQMLALERARDAKENIDTRPSDAEAVTFRSVTTAEIYAGQAADALITTLGTIEWVSFDEPILGRIAEARKGDHYSRGYFRLVSDMPPLAARFGYSSGLTDLPSGIDRIHCEYYVLGPSIMAVVLTFVLTADEAKRIDVSLREDAESRHDHYGTYSIRRSVREVKHKRILDVQEEVIRRCLQWLNSKMPGTLSVTNEWLGPPTCALVSLAVGKPFAPQAGYVALLDLLQPYIAHQFVRRNFLFVIQLLGGAVGSWMMAVFNEAEAVSSGWLRDPEYAPELFHQEISSLMIADGLTAVLRSFEPRLLDIRADLNRLDIDEPAETKVIGLRNRLLELSREVSTGCGDVRVLVDGAVMIWADFSPLVQVKLNGDTSESADITADTKRRQLRLVIESLQTQEVGLRELIIVTSAAMNETRALNLTKTLNRLTWVLVFLTIVVLGVAIVQLVSTSTESAPHTPTSPAVSRTASPAPRPSPSSSGSPSNTKALGLQG